MCICISTPLFIISPKSTQVQTFLLEKVFFLALDWKGLWFSFLGYLYAYAHPVLLLALCYGIVMFFSLAEVSGYGT